MARSEAEWVVSGPDELAPVRHALAGWLGGEGCLDGDDVLLVFSELVTNAIAHGGGSAIVGVDHERAGARLEVRDRSPSPPQVRLPSTSGHGGFGLRIVGQLSAEWGWRPATDGKVVWAVVPCEFGR